MIENTLEPAHEGKHEYRNTIIIQTHPDYQSRYDSAKSIICSWFNLLRTSITQKPIIVGSLNESEHIQTDNSVEVFIDVRRGKLDCVLRSIRFSINSFDKLDRTEPMAIDHQ